MNTKLKKENVRIKIRNKNIKITGKTFAFQVNFDDISSLHIDCEQKVFAEEMEIELAKVEKFYPELQNKLRIAIHTPQISCVFTANRVEGDKIARLNYERFKDIIINGIPQNFFEEHKQLAEKFHNSDDLEEISYPIHFHACGNSFGDKTEEGSFEFNEDSVRNIKRENSATEAVEVKE